MVFGLFGVREEHDKHDLPVHAAALEVKPLEHLPDLQADQEPQVKAPPETDTAADSDDLCRETQQDLQNIGRRLLKGLRLISGQIKHSEKNQLALAEKLQIIEQGYLRELQTIRSCQQQTAQILNHEVERHALNPAIEALVAVAEEFSRLEQKVTALKSKGGLCPAWAEVAGELDISATVVAEKLRALNIVIIRPERNEPMDAAQHDVCGQTETCEAHLQGKIQSVVSCGIQYRNKMLKRARVVVYRFKSN